MIVLIVQRFDLSTVSCARRVLSEARELSARGHRVMIVDFPHDERRSQFSTYTLLERNSIRTIRLGRRAVDTYRNCRTIIDLDPQPDIVHLWKSYPDAALPALVAADHSGVPLHYDWDDWEPAIAHELTGSRLAAHLARLWDRAILGACDSCSVASKRIREFALDWGMPKNRIWDAPVGADIDLFQPRPPDPEILERIGNPKIPILVYVGQLEVATYAETAVDVISVLRERGIPVLLLVIGGGRYEQRLRKAAEEKGVSEFVKCTGYVPGDEVPRWLSVGSVALAPFQDTLVAQCKSPLKIAEYLAMGLAIVASDVGDARVMVENAGLLCPPGDAEAMAECVQRILSDEDLGNSFRITSRERAEEKYNWSWHVDQLERAYEAALG